MKLSLKIKGALGAVAAALALISYVVYYYAWYELDIRLREAFFIGTGLAIFISFGLLFTLFQNKVVRALTLFCSIFYFILVSTYIISGICLNKFYAHIEISLFIGLCAGLIALVYDSLNNRRSNGV